MNAVTVTATTLSTDDGRTVRMVRMDQDNQPSDGVILIERRGPAWTVHATPADMNGALMAWVGERVSTHGSPSDTVSFNVVRPTSAVWVDGMDGLEEQERLDAMIGGDGDSYQPRYGW